MRRVHNFSAGPCTLPLEVLEETQSEFLNFAGNGMSIIEDANGVFYNSIRLQGRFYDFNLLRRDTQVNYFFIF